MVEQTTHIDDKLQSRIIDLEKEIKEVKKAVDGIASMSIDPDTLRGLRNLVYLAVCDLIRKTITEKGSISLDDVEGMLIEWGLNLKNRQFAKKIVSIVSPWTESRHIQVPLNEAIYENHRIILSSNGKRLYIPAKLLPFDTSEALEHIKEIFEGTIEVDYRRDVRFEWDVMSRKLSIKTLKTYTPAIKVDDNIIGNFKSILAAFSKLSARFTPFIAASILKTGLRTGIKRRSGFMVKIFDPRFIKILEAKATNSYMTSIDFWFEINGLLVWERPEFGAATYIFSMPNEDLLYFICRIWASKLYDIRHSPKSGYKGRVIHNYDDISKWETNLDKIL